MYWIALPNNAQLELVEVEATPSNSNSSNSVTVCLQVGAQVT
jgi:hypothetical protein